jgi:oligopeptide/dipeptide ABC transporter ATP-binding protein
MALLEVRDLRKDFPLRRTGEAVHAVNGVSFEVEPGETLGLVGESGSGKTTVGRLLVKLLDATSGSIVFKGTDITRLSARAFRPLRASAQMVFQDPADSLNPRLTVMDAIRGPLVSLGNMDSHGQQARVRELIELVELEPRNLRMYPHQLSAGQQQRVGVARALATRPDLVVLDEPISNLDPMVRVGVLETLRDIQEQTGVAYVFISHDLSTIEEVSHRVAIMYLGEIAEMGTTQLIFARQMHPYSRALLSSVLYPDPNVVVPRFPLVGEIPSPIHLPRGCYLAGRCPLADEHCRIVHPDLREFEGGRRSACHHAEEVVAFKAARDENTVDSL